MTRWEYTAQVQANLHRVTKREREAIRAEIDAHMEDHICGLLELGYSQELAEERTMTFMGDPAEVGRELNKQYPLCWLVVKWAAIALTLTLAVLLLTQVEWQAVKDNLVYRFCPSEQFAYEEDYDFLEGDSTDIRVELGSSVVRICAAGVTEIQPGTTWAERYSEEQYLAVVIIRTYRESLWELGRYAEMPGSLNIMGQEKWSASGGFYWIPVKRGETALTAAYQEHGYNVSVSIPLNWGDIL